MAKWKESRPLERRYMRGALRTESIQRSASLSPQPSSSPERAVPALLSPSLPSTPWPDSRSSSRSSSQSSSRSSTDSSDSDDDLQPPSLKPVETVWTCHLCTRSWNIGTTQRCLHCSHRMCLLHRHGQQALSRNNNTSGGGSGSGGGSREYTRGIKRPTVSPNLRLLFPLTSSLSIDQSQPGNNNNNNNNNSGTRSVSPTYSSVARYRYTLSLKDHFQRSRARKASHTRMANCRLGFDHSGWEMYNRWRRRFHAEMRKRRAAAASTEAENGSVQQQRERDTFETEDEDEDSQDDDENNSDSDKENNYGDEDEEEAFRLIPDSRGRSYVVVRRATAEHDQAHERDCWDNCDFPGHCLRGRNSDREIKCSLRF